MLKRFKQFIKSYNSEMYNLFLKRGLDVTCSFLALVCLSPILLVTGFIIWVQDFGPAIFRHQRVGKNGKLFEFYKFRSMPVNTPNVQSSETSKLKITPFGKFIRRSNIDELPQLVNILKGDMSIIGPRPPIPAQGSLVRLRKENGALSCRPGLTGLAQVNSYDFMPEEEKAKWDGVYAKDISFLNDVKILFKTLFYLIKKPPTY